MNLVERSGAVIRNLQAFIHPPLSSAERQERLEDILRKYPLTNQLVWYHIIAARGFLSPTERTAIVDSYKTYKELYPHDSTPVTELLKLARLPRVAEDPFFGKVCFNYEVALDVGTRWQAAMRELLEGKRKSVGDSEKDEEFWRVEEWVDYDFYNLLHNHEIAGRLGFRDDIHQQGVTKITTGEGMIHPRPWTVKGIYQRDILPLLAVDEVLKPGEPRFYFGFGIRNPNDPTMVTEVFTSIPKITARDG